MNKIYEYLDDIGTNDFIRTIYEIVTTYFDEPGVDHLEGNMIDRLISIIEGITKSNDTLDIMEKIYGGEIVNRLKLIRIEIITGDIEEPDTSCIYFYKENNVWVIYYWDNEWIPIGLTDYELLNYWNDDSRLADRIK